MLSIEKIFSSLESAYRRTEQKFLQRQMVEDDGEELITRCMDLFRPLYLTQPSLTGLEAYFRYLIRDAKSVGDIPFNFLIEENERTEKILAALQQALELITGEKQCSCTVEETQLLNHFEEELTSAGESPIYIIRNCRTTPMTPDERIAWNVVAELFELTPRVVRILCAPKTVIEKRFREVDHIYYRVFRNSIRTREETAEDLFKLLIAELNRKEFCCEDAFLDEMKLYVDTIYPKADLKGDAFVSDLVERIVHKYFEKSRSGLLLDAECVPFYHRPDKTKEKIPEAVLEENESTPSKKEEQSTILLTELPEVSIPDDPLVDDYVSTAHPPVENVLIVSLSTFPYRLSECTYQYNGSMETPPESGIYFYQQEPFPMRLKEHLANRGEIIMLTTPETRKVTWREKNGEVFQMSPQGYFMDSVRKIPGLENICFKSVEMNQDNPIDAVAEVVSHLRTLKRKVRTKKECPRVFLGTNGGLRGNQLILEAVLSLLTVDGIVVCPDHVWSMREINKGKWEVFNSAAEFKIFDFVSGINEFLNYGRTTSLENFLCANPELNDADTVQIMECIRKIAQGIQFCSISGFESGLDELQKYFTSATVSENIYLEMFRDNIRNDYGPLLSSEREILDEVEWCAKKGFFQQAITLVESALPREYFRKRIIAYDMQTKQAAECYKKRNEDIDSFIFNHSVVWHINELLRSITDWKNPQRQSWSDNSHCECTIETKFIVNEQTAVHAGQFREMLKKHVALKDIRNGLNHIGERQEKSTEEYRKALLDYIHAVKGLYHAQDVVHFPALMSISLVQDTSNRVTEPVVPAGQRPVMTNSAVVVSITLDGISLDANIGDLSDVTEIGKWMVMKNLSEQKDPNAKKICESLSELKDECNLFAKLRTASAVMKRRDELTKILQILAIRQKFEAGFSGKLGNITQGLLNEYFGKSSDGLYSVLYGWIGSQLYGGEEDCKCAVYAVLTHE